MLINSLKNIQEDKMIVNRDVSQFGEEGYLLHSLESKEGILLARRFFEAELKKRVGEDATLESYHNFVQDDNTHSEIQYELFRALTEKQFHLAFFTENKIFFDSLVGLDIDVQVKPYLRIARPEKPQDNVGIHNDLDYGASAYEVSCVFNLTKLNKQGAIGILPRSHAKPRTKTKTVLNEGVEKGSIKHQMGIPYMFQRLPRESYLSKMVPVSMEIGDVLCFGLGVTHGQEVNHSSETRWTIDSRFKNSFIDSPLMKEGYYNPLSRSPVVEAAKKHYEINPEKDMRP